MIAMRKPFLVHAAAVPFSPVVISVPHAGREYPEAMTSLARVTPAQMLRLEDRHADRLASAAFAEGHDGLVAQTARGWIDLNRRPDEIDPEFAEIPEGIEPFLSPKLRGGLGLIPRRIAGAGELWAARLTRADIAARIAQHHQPYHVQLEAMLRRAHAHFGIAILLDLHSMPPPARGAMPVPQIVIGDLHGRAASAAIARCALAEANAAGFRSARNHPYAGGYVLARHGAPARGVHALQVEIDRQLYLDAALEAPGRGLTTMTRFVARLAAALAAQARDMMLPLAAE